ncbi:MAG: hypothetical protein ETSY2_32080 [Candidatus Entotheonella gemina]|uniref:P-type ATPase A domain-containing protein n=1 Tax=Candidatus Entotheonella gemina TaxID=1429439 RepID=W4M176_9BACT|nr:MAG: hypothetical protein ETSY2_32080 [Candidatus Entotheonella gemina]
MVLIELSIAGGALYAGTKAYTKRRNKSPGANFLRPTKPHISWYAKLRTALHQLTSRSHIGTNGHPAPQRLVSAQVETNCLATQSGSGVQPRDEDEQVVNRNLALAAGLMGLTVAGHLGFPLLTLSSVPGLVYLEFTAVRNAYRQLVHDRRVGIAVVDAVLSSSLLVLRYFFVDALVLTIQFLSHKLVHQTRNRSTQRLVNVFGDIPQHVWVQRGDVEVQVPLEDVQIGDSVVVHAAEIIPVDGVITAGIATIDQHRLTGEAQPAEKGVGDAVFAATLLLSGTIWVRVDHAEAATVSAQIAAILRQTADYQSSWERQGAAIADRSALPTLALSAATLPFLGPMRALAVLTAWLGYDLRVTAPLSLLNFLHLASEQGLLIKDGRALEALQHVDTVVFDKTGTLTLSQPHVAAIHPCSGDTEDTILRYAAAAEYKQTHPLAQAILQEAGTRHLDLPPIHDAMYEIGYGLKVNLDGKHIRVGSARFMAMEGIEIPASIRTVQAHCDAHGYSLVYVAANEDLIGVIELHATIRPEAKSVIRSLQQRHLAVTILSGDLEQPTQQLAQELGVEQYVAEVLPERKATLIAELQGAGKSVCFIGDGINDAIALKQADVSISLSGASTLATDTAQILMMDAGLTHLVSLFDLAQRLQTNMRTNFVADFGANLLSLGAIYGLHVGVVPLIIFTEFSLAGGVVNAMWPRLKNDIGRDRHLPETV